MTENDEFSDELEALAAAEESVEAAPNPPRIAWASVARNIKNVLNPDDKAEVQVVVDAMVANPDAADDNPKLPGSQLMVARVNNHLRLVYTKRHTPEGRDHQGFSILTIARDPGQMWRLTDVATHR